MESAGRTSLRLWPGVIAAVLLCLFWIVLPILEPDAIGYSAAGAFACALLIVVWWLLFSRARWFERVGAIALIVVAMYAIFPLLHVSIRTAMNGRMFPIYAIFVVTPALVAWAVVTRRLSDRVRRAAMVATILASCGA